MLLIRPKTINNTSLLSSNVAESAPDFWAGDVTYALGDQARRASATAVISNNANTTVTSLGTGLYRIEKTGGVNGAFDASAVSSIGITGDFTLRIAHNSGATANISVLGMNSDPLTDNSYASIDFAWGFLYNGNWQISTNGSLTTVVSSATFVWIWRVGGTLNFGHGASFLAASAVPDGSLPSTAALYFDSSIWNSAEKYDVLLSYSTAAPNAKIPIYSSLQASNLNNDPATATAWWGANGYVYPSWSSSSLYALGDLLTDTTAHRIYESLSGGTAATVTMTIASPCVVTWNAHGLAANTPITFTTTGALPTGLTVGTVYYVLSPTTNTFNVSAIAGGAAINTSGSQSGVHTATANPNLNKAITDPTFWLNIGPSNKWAMFDDLNGTVTTDAALIDVTMALSGRLDSLALLGLENVVSVRVIASTLADGTVYDVTTDLTSTDGISDWYSWFFEEIERKSNLLLTDLPNYNNPSVSVIITGTGTTTIECGNLVIGQSKDLGRTLHDGASVGITDYSRKDVDAFGNYTIVQRAFAKRGSFKMRIAKSQVDGIEKLLSQYRATPAVYSASADYGSTLIWGFFKDFQIEIDYPTESLVSIEIEGLT